MYRMDINKSSGGLRTKFLYTGPRDFFIVVHFTFHFKTPPAVNQKSALQCHV